MRLLWPVTGVIACALLFTVFVALALLSTLHGIAGSPL
jgi:hypothetical protein